MVDYSKWDKFAAEITDSDSESEDINVTKFDKPTAVRIPDKKKKFEKKLDPARNGGKNATHLWGQNEKECWIYIIIPGMTSSKEIYVSIENSVVHVQRNKNTIIKGTLAHKIKSDTKKKKILPEDIDWELVDWKDVHEGSKDTKYVKIHFQKETILSGCIHWWPRIFLEDDKVDVTSFPDRRHREKPSAKSFQNAWQKAHEEFKKKIRRPVIID
jgi:hypothetical protein